MSVTKMSVTTMSYFRLFDLPLDLLELLTLYFEGKEAVKLLTLSSNFHEIFARSVWRIIGRRVIDVAEPIRSSAYARYGHLVRSIDLLDKLDLDFDSHNWAQLFPNTTSMAFDIFSWIDYSDKQTFMDAIADLHGLRSLEIKMETNIPPFDLKTLTRVLVARHGDPSKQSLREVIMFFSLGEEREEDEEDDDDHVKSWINFSSFVQTISLLRPSINLQIDAGLYYSAIAPTPAQMNIIRPHLTSVPDIDEAEDEYGCVALHNRQLFSPSGTRDDPLVFGQLCALTITVCCTSPLLFDYSDFTPTKFPVMEWLNISGVICRRQSEDGADSAIQTLLTQKWPELTFLRVHGSGLTFTILDKLVEFNPQLTRLSIEIRRNTVDTDGVFMLERVTGRLPHLIKFMIHGKTSISVDSGWLLATSLADIRSSKLRSITIYTTMLKPRFFEVLLALPSLHSIEFGNCVLAEPELVMDVFKKQRRTVKESTNMGIRSLIIDTRRTNNNWSTQFIFEIIASFPHLESCGIYGSRALEDAFKNKYPKFRR